MMLYYAGNCSRSSTYTVTQTGTTTGTAGTCCCPNCGYWHDCDPWGYTDNRSAFTLSEPEPAPQRVHWTFPLPKSDHIPRQHFAVARSGFRRSGHQRGVGFRNFRKDHY